jgi:hypothetical protein
MLHARREICEIVRCIPERFLGNCQIVEFDACVRFWECGGYVTSHKNGEQTPSQKATSDCGENDRRQQPAARDGEGWPQLPPAGVLFAVLSEMRERCVVTSEHRIWTP